MNTNNLPTTFVIFGGTGDLMEKKLAPALYNLSIFNNLPKNFKVIVVSRREFSGDDYTNYLKGIVPNAGPSFFSLFEYLKGDFSDPNLYKKLSEIVCLEDKKSHVCANKAYYLAVPPTNYESIVESLGEVGLNKPCGHDGGYTRIILEKPFGYDSESAGELQKLLREFFTEDQIYRLDHYLGKTMFANLLAFRFSNNLFEGAWSNKYIEKVEIKLLETIDSSGRGSFYDSMGALRDVGQNHLLELLAAVTMDNPGSLRPEDLRRERSKILSRLLEIPKDRLVAEAVRGQYEGYRRTDGVAPSSMRETYFKLVANLSHPLWDGVPFYIEAGKALNSDKKEVVITFKKPIGSLPVKGLVDGRNKLLFKMSPSESIQLDLWAKKEGYEMVLEDKRFFLNEKGERKIPQYTEEYERLLLYMLSGDQTFFVSSDEVSAQWKFIDPIVCAFDEDIVRLTPYAPGTDEIRDFAKSYLRQTENRENRVKAVGIVGLGKMGGNFARQIVGKGYKVVGFNRSKDKYKIFENEGIKTAESLKDLVSALPAPRLVILSLPHGEPTNTTILELSEVLEKGDTVLDFGNSHYTDAKTNYKVLKNKSIDFVDVGVSGGPHGALTGASLMVGNNRKAFEELLPFYLDIAVPGGVAHFEGVGAGHFVKMVHNAIEYGMMQSVAEGFTLLARSNFVIDLKSAASVYSHGSVIESKLVSHLYKAFWLYGNELSSINGSVESNGEADWALTESQKENTVNWALKAAIDFRAKTAANPDFTGRVLSAIRGQFGEHDVLAQKTKNE